MAGKGGGLNENVPRKLPYLNTWFLAGAVWEEEGLKYLWEGKP